jgi:hypothetical protein
LRANTLGLWGNYVVTDDVEVRHSARFCGKQESKGQAQGHILWSAICPAAADRQAVLVAGTREMTSHVLFAGPLLFSSSSRRSRGPQPTAPPMACHMHLQVRQNTNEGPEFPAFSQPYQRPRDTKTPFRILSKCRAKGPNRGSLPLPQVPKNASPLVLPLFQSHICRHRQLRFPISDLPHPPGGI